MPRENTEVKAKVLQAMREWISIREAARVTALTKNQVAGCVTRHRGIFDQRHIDGEFQYRLVSCRERE